MSEEREERHTLVVLLVSTLSMIFHAFVFMTLWRWFIFPTLNVAADMRFSFGATFIWSCLKGINADPDKDIVFIKKTLKAGFAYLLLLGIAYVTHFILGHL